MNKVIYVLDRNVVSEIKNYIANKKSKREVIDFLKSIDREGNIISILPAINESVLAKKLGKNDKDKFVESAEEEIQMVDKFFQVAQNERKVFKGFPLEKYFEDVILDPYRIEQMEKDLKVIKLAIQLYIETECDKDRKVVIEKFISQIDQNKLNNNSVELYCCLFLLNFKEGDNSIRKVFVDAKDKKNYKRADNKEEWLDKKSYNTLMDFEFIKARYYIGLRSGNINNYEIKLYTEDKSLKDVINHFIEVRGKSYINIGGETITKFEICLKDSEKVRALREEYKKEYPWIERIPMIMNQSIRLTYLSYLIKKLMYNNMNF